MAREGADVSICYLPVEQGDAEDTKKMVEAENQKCHLIPGDLRKYDFCQQVVQEHLQVYAYSSLPIFAKFESNIWMQPWGIEYTRQQCIEAVFMQ